MQIQKSKLPKNAKKFEYKLSIKLNLNTFSSNLFWVRFEFAYHILISINSAKEIIDIRTIPKIEIAQKTYLITD